MSVHGLLAADLALDESVTHSKWNAVMPTKEEVMASLPLAWDPDLQEYFPKPARDSIRKQQTRFKRDWDIVHATFPSLLEDDYLYAWLLVNTRTFYYTTPKTEKLPRHDRMILQPVADLLNHADEGCSVSFDGRGFTIRSGRAYAAGEEVCICYGRHGNDVLLAEYGFALAAGRNRWDEVCLDGTVLPRLSARQRRHLEDRGFLGNYKLDAATVCYRTQVALRILCVPLGEWRDVVDGLDDGEAQQGEVDRLLILLLRELREGARETIANIEGAKAGLDHQRQALKDRWVQIIDLVSSTILRLESSVAQEST